MEKSRLNKPLLIFFKIVVYSAIFYAFKWLTTVITGNSMPSVAFLLTVILLITNRGKLTNFIQTWIDKSFYQTLYRLKRSTDNFDDELNSTLEFDVLLNKCQAFLDYTFTPEQYTAYVYNGTGFERLYNASTNGNSNRIIEFPPDKFKGDLFEKNIRFYSASEIQEHYPDFVPLLASAQQADRQHSYFLPLKGTHNIVGFILFSNSLKHYIKIPEVNDFLIDLFEKTASVLENAQNHREIKRKSLESQLLLEIVKKITATLNLHDVLENIIDNLSALVRYDAASVILVDDHKKILRQTVARGYKEKCKKLISLKLDQGISGWVVQTGQGIIVPDVTQNERYYPARPLTKSQVTVPIISRDEPIGALVLESDTLDHFTQNDLELLTIFSGLAAVTIRNAQLYEDSLKKKRLESDLLIASKVQQTLLRKRVPTIDGLKIEVKNIPSQYVGGDLYDVFKIGQQRQGISIGDGSGKGAPGAILMAVAYAGFKSLFNEVDPVATTIARLNNLLAEATTYGYFVTYFFGIIDLENCQFVYCNAGHNPPVLMRKDKSIEFLENGGTVLGFMPNLNYTQTAIPIHPGDYLCLYTDGVTELQNDNDEEFGEERLIEVLKTNYGKPPRAMKFAILDAMKEFAGDTELQDDVTLVVVYVE